MNQSTTRYARVCGALICAAMVSSCSLPGAGIFQNTTAGTELAAGEQGNTHFFTKETYHNSGLSLVSGANYSLNISILSHWIDSTIDKNETGTSLDEKGFDNSVMPFEFVGMTRRSRAHNWFELMLVQPNCGKESLRGISDLEFDEAKQSYEFTASCNGNLNLYVNDSYGFYGNNVGYANISVSRLN